MGMGMQQSGTAGGGGGMDIMSMLSPMKLQSPPGVGGTGGSSGITGSGLGQSGMKGGGQSGFGQGLFGLPMGYMGQFGPMAPGSTMRNPQQAAPLGSDSTRFGGNFSIGSQQGGGLI